MTSVLTVGLATSGDVTRLGASKCVQANMCLCKDGACILFCIYLFIFGKKEWKSKKAYFLYLVMLCIGKHRNPYLMTGKYIVKAHI